MSKLGICGISGRMGRAILRILLERGHTLKGAFEAESSPFLGQDAGSMAGGGSLGVKIDVVSEDSIKGLDGIIDFTSPDATLNLIDLLKKNSIPVVIGTTGIPGDDVKKIEDLSSSVPVLFSPNMSVGVNLLFKLTEIASSILKGDYDIEIFEAHHKYKKDAPSGTANRLLEIIKKTVPELNDANEVYGRSGITGERGKNEIGVMAMRGGDIVGEHTVYYIGKEERIELTHRASSRDTFARGAVIGMEYIISNKSGMYNMFDVLGL